MNWGNKSMLWETAKKYMSSMDIKNIKSLAKLNKISLSGKEIEEIFQEILYRQDRREGRHGGETPTWKMISAIEDKIRFSRGSR